MASVNHQNAQDLASQQASLQPDQDAEQSQPAGQQ
jgi:hypothetical protein